ncbi:MAG: hypothetical protein K6E50_08465 [Lachnospiraceae bacterium]|nr:hypothetical protein [Lachnospiraceae bacterium]
MSIFSKKEKLIVGSEAQKEVLIEKLEKAGVEYVLRENKDLFNEGHPSYTVIIEAKNKALIA